MKIKKIHVEHYKCIDNLDYDVEGKDIIICGDNERGKSSLMQFIQIALGKKINIPADGNVVVNKNGEEFTFEVKSNKGGKNVVRVIYPDKSKDDRVGSLTEVCGTMSFDINDFVKQSETLEGQKKQAELFLALLPEDIQKEIKRLEANVVSNYSDRTEIGKDLKKLEGALKSSPLYNDINKLDTFKPVDIVKLNNDIELANKLNNNIIIITDQIKQKKETISKNDIEIIRLQELIEGLKADNKLKSEEIAKGDVWLKSNKEIDTAPYIEKMKLATKTNQDSDEAIRVKKQIADIEQKKEEIGNLTVLVDSGRQAILDCIKDFPTAVDGLFYSDSMLMYAPKNNVEPVPVTSDNLSTSTIIELGLKMVYAQNPELPMFIENSNVIGKERMAAIRKFAEEHDLQLILEKVVPGQENLSIELFG